MCPTEEGTTYYAVTSAEHEANKARVERENAEIGSRRIECSVMTRRAELLAPAGNPEKLRFAVDYGADAVLLRAGQVRRMRAAADNFTPESLAEGVHYAHERGVKVYVTLNTMPRDRGLPAGFRLMSPACLRDAQGADAFIVADTGVAGGGDPRRISRRRCCIFRRRRSAINSAALPVPAPAGDLGGSCWRAEAADD